MDEPQKVLPRRPDMFSNYPPTKSGYIRETGNHLIKSLSTPTVAAPAAAPILAPPTTVPPRPTKPTTMSTAKHIPAKPSPKARKNSQALEDHYSPYSPEPLPEPVASSVAVDDGDAPDNRFALHMPGLGTFRIDNDIALPEQTNGRVKKDWTALLKALKPGESVALDIKAQSMVAKHISQAHKDKIGTWVRRVNADKTGMRVWRVA